MTLIDHAKRELALLRDPSSEPDELQDAIEAHILKMVEVFGEAGHSGSSGDYALGILKKVLAFEPVSPLTGSDEEWVEVGSQNGKPLYQNNRCGRVFREGDDYAYDIEGRVFRGPDGTCWTGRESRVAVTFPYTPATEIIDRPASAA